MGDGVNLAPRVWALVTSLFLLCCRRLGRSPPEVTGQLAAVLSMCYPAIAEAYDVFLSVLLALSIAAVAVFRNPVGLDRVEVLCGKLGTLFGPGTGALDLAMKAGSHLLRSKQIHFSFFPLALSHSQRDCSPMLDLGSFVALKLKPDCVLGG